MKLRSRRILFYSLIVVFLTVSASVILYAQGFRIDRDTFSLTSRGGMYIVSSPSEASIALDDRAMKHNSGLFQRGTLINGLAPRNHVLTLSAPGYRPWRRTVPVEASKVADIQYAVLTPESPARTVATSVTSFWLANGVSGVEGNLPLLATDRGFLINDLRFTSPGAPIEWNESRTQFLTRAASGSRAYALVSVAEATSTSLTALITRTGASPNATSTRVMIDGAYEGRVIVQAATGIWLLDADRRTVLQIATSTAAQASLMGSIGASRSEVAWATFNSASSTSRITVYDRSLRQQRVLGAKLEGSITSLHFENNNLLSILQANGNFFTYDLQRNELSQRGAKIRHALFSPDDRMLALLGEESLEIFSIGTSDYVRFNLNDVRSVTSMSWHQNDHALFVSYPDHVAFVDVTDSLLENIVNIGAVQGAYDADANELYVLNNGALSVFQFAKN